MNANNMLFCFLLVAVLVCFIGCVSIVAIAIITGNKAEKIADKIVRDKSDRIAQEAANKVFERFNN